ncbi:MAG: hydantoinase B/oxoprolinase family protein [Myxococcota bacterium]
MAGRWQVWIDRGGTFTDCIGVDPVTGHLKVAKVLSSDRAPIDGVRQLLGLEPGSPIPPVVMRMGTTMATNALLQRRGRRVALLITRGFRDLLVIGDQSRPELFALRIERPAPLYEDVVEVDARADSEGRVLQRPTVHDVEQRLRTLREQGYDSLAIAVLNGHRCPSLEQGLGAVAERCGFLHIVLSHELSSETGFLARASTACLDAYLTPLLQDYLRGLHRDLPGSDIKLMQSGGGLVESSRFRGAASLLSGPAGGVVACARVVEHLGLQQGIGLDMGGTSTDVCRIGPGGTYEQAQEHDVAGVRVRAPMVSVHTVAAGGGSLCQLRDGRLVVGPESAGAVPGPLCYGAAEAKHLTITDVNLALGRLLPDRFPFPLDHGRVSSSLQELGKKTGLIPESVAEGFFRIANARMAEAIRQVSVRCGFDPREHHLIVFGGAGGQHACALARLLKVRSVILHPLAGVFSAVGIGQADVRWQESADLGDRELTADALASLSLHRVRLEHLVREGFRRQHHVDDPPDLEVSIELRYPQADARFAVGLGTVSDMRRDFEGQHRRRFGYVRATDALHIVAMRVTGIARTRARTLMAEAMAGAKKTNTATRLFCEGVWHDDVPVLWRGDLLEGERHQGPLLVLEQTGTIVVEPGFVVEVGADGILTLRECGSFVSHSVTMARDPVSLELAHHAFGAIAEQMGEVLRRTARSTNIRERLDFSCAVFDAAGALVANAPHIPVHLGAMAETVRCLLEEEGPLEQGDVYVSNDPARGGSHLPDVTVVTPVHDEDGTLLGHVACRGHHADIGGITPGSMPPFSSTIEEEGIILPALRVICQGSWEGESLLACLQRGPHPARDPAQNLADVEAQVAANLMGRDLLLELAGRWGKDVLAAQMSHLQDNAAETIAAAIAALPDGERHFRDSLDDGSVIQVRLVVAGDRLTIDFSGTAEVSTTNLNAPKAVTTAAVLYALRLLAGRPIPLSSGCLRHIDIRIPAGSLLDPPPGAAVVAGNVETSQRIVDVLLAAFGLQAASQGTMNNLTLGDETFGYYETSAGVSGAGRGYDGVSGVHTHMTNTRITDPEVLEARFPLRVRRFSLREKSGGAGRWQGGNGVVRELEATAKLQGAMVSERRTTRPFGLAGGEPGASGKVLVRGEEIAGRATFQLEPGDTITVLTPGGGGYGAVVPQSSYRAVPN